jgi:uncharacterized protein YceH (UPF0502 family)
VHLAELTAPEQRVLGCLIEKRWTTPDQYPLSINALRLACNQSTNRDPVTTYDEATVRVAAQRLSRYGLTRLASGHSSRAIKYRHLAEEALGLDRGQLAILCVLLLRGAQTPGELKSRSERMASFDSLTDVEHVLDQLGERGYARRLARRPGQKEDRFEQLLGANGDGGGDGVPTDPAEMSGANALTVAEAADAGASSVPPVEDERRGAVPAVTDTPAVEGPPAPMSFGSDTQRTEGLQRRMDGLEAELERLGRLEAEVARLRAELDDLRMQLGG